jgi:predicted secreted protein
MGGGWVRRLLIGVPVGGVAGLAAWSLVAGSSSGWGVGAGVAAAVAGAFAPSVLDLWRKGWAERDRRAGELAGILVAELPASVGWLLHPDKKVIGFFGRAWVLRQLENWCADADASVVRLVTAPGGYGKSRLAGRFVAGLSGWVAWRVAVGAEAATATVINAGGVPSRLLLVVDYAESRDAAGLAALLCAAVRRSDGGWVRVLLLARAAGPWWTSLSASYPQQAALIDSLTLADNTVALEAQADQRCPQEIVASAVEQFAQHLGYRVPVGYRCRSHPAGTPLLRLHAEALVAVLGGPRSGDGCRDVLAEVLGHESRYWRGCARRAGVRLPADVGRADALLAELVGVAALLGADDDDEVEGIVRRVPGLARADAATVCGLAGWLRDLYPPDASIGRTGRLGTLQPDLLAEHLVVHVLTGWTGAQRAVIFTGLSPDQAVRALTVLGRAATDRPTVARLIDGVLAADLVVMARAVLHVARQFPGLFVVRLARLLATADADVDVLRGLVDEVPYPSLELHPVALVLTTRITAEGNAASASERAGWLTWHALVLAEAGRRAEALAVSQDAVDLYRELAATSSDAYLPDLAASMNNHALRLAEAGQRTEALAVSQEAVDLCRELAATNRDAHLPNLAASVINHAVRLAEAGRREALAVSQEAVDLYRELAGGNRDKHLPNLATSVSNHAVQLAEAGRREALAVSQEAVDLRRELAGGRAAYLPDLAASMINHALWLAEAGRRAEALAVSQEAVDLYRELATTNRDAHLPNLAASVINHANRLAEAGRAEALTVSQEAVDLYRELATTNRDAHLPNLAISVAKRAVWLAEAGRRAEALTVSQETVDLCRELATTNRDGYLPDLAGSVINHAVWLAEADRRAEALAVSQEAVDLYRELAATNRDGYLPHLANSVNNHAHRLAEAGRHTEALTVSLEAVDLCGELAATDRDAHLPNLPASVINYMLLGGRGAGGVLCVWLPR